MAGSAPGQFGIDIFLQPDLAIFQPENGLSIPTIEIVDDAAAYLFDAFDDGLVFQAKKVLLTGYAGYGARLGRGFGRRRYGSRGSLGARHGGRRRSLGTGCWYCGCYYRHRVRAGASACQLVETGEACACILNGSTICQ